MLDVAWREVTWEFGWTGSGAFEMDSFSTIGLNLNGFDYTNSSRLQFEPQNLRGLEFPKGVFTIFITCTIERLDIADLYNQKVFIADYSF